MEVDFNKGGGLVPAIVQAAGSREVLMLGYMNAEALRLTLATGYVTFYSRSRREIWAKGATSGNRMKLIRLWQDCDGDALLAEAELEGAGAACHTGSRSCFAAPCGGGR